MHSVYLDNIQLHCTCTSVAKLYVHTYKYNLLCRHIYVLYCTCVMYKLQHQATEIPMTSFFPTCVCVCVLCVWFNVLVLFCIIIHWVIPVKVSVFSSPQMEDMKCASLSDYSQAVSWPWWSSVTHGNWESVTSRCVNLLMCVQLTVLVLSTKYVYPCGPYWV